MLGGGMVCSVRGTTIVADPARRVEGAYAALPGVRGRHARHRRLRCARTSRQLRIDLRDRTTRCPRDRESNLVAHRQARSFATQEDEYAFKNATLLGGGRSRTGPDAPAAKHQFFGLTIVSCERGAIRQSPDVIIVYGQDAWHEEKFAPRLYTEIELDLMYRAWANDEPLEYCDGPWGKATTETGLGIIRSAAERREIHMDHQVPLPADRPLL